MTATTSSLCRHEPTCPPAGSPDREAAQTVATHPERFSGAVLVAGRGAAAAPAGGARGGVPRGAPADMRTGSGAFEVQSERGRDIRRDLAREIVDRGWGLLELRPMRLSLEEVFLQVTTEETPSDAPAVSEGEATHA